MPLDKFMQINDDGEHAMPYSRHALPTADVILVHCANLFLEQGDDEFLEGRGGLNDDVTLDNFLV
jgi:hypothetical protein